MKKPRLTDEIVFCEQCIRNKCDFSVKKSEKVHKKV